MHRCPLVDSYTFTEYCTVESCKNHTKVTEDRCISLNCEDSDGVKVSEIEIQYFKGLKSVSSVTTLRKQAESRVWRIIILDDYVSKCDEHVKLDVESTVIQEWLRSWPMSTKLWPSIMSKIWNVLKLRKYNKYKKTLSTKGKYELHDLLWLTPKKFKLLQREVNKQM